MGQEATYTQGRPPIVGDEGGSVHLTPQGYVTGPPLSDLGSRLADGIYFGLDMQPDNDQEQFVFGMGVEGGTALLLSLNADGVPERVKVTVRDSDGKTLVAYSDTSPSKAKRIICNVQPTNNAVIFFEIQPWTVDINLRTHYLRQEGPRTFSDFAHGLMIGGWNIGGTRVGSFAGRVAEVYVGAGELPSSRIAAYRTATTNPTELGVTATVGRPSIDSQRLFLDDLATLRAMGSQFQLDDAAVRDASVILYRWRFDRHPMLKQICDGYGIQAWFPGQGERARQYLDAVLADGPVFAQHGTGSGGPMGFEWKTLAQFRGEPAFHVEGHAVSHEALIKFVRNKLGGGHFDELDRTKWQQDLLALARAIQLNGQPAINHQMLALLRGIVEAVEGCGIHLHLRR